MLENILIGIYLLLISSPWWGFCIIAYWSCKNSPDEDEKEDEGPTSYGSSRPGW